MRVVHLTVLLFGISAVSCTRAPNQPLGPREFSANGRVAEIVEGRGFCEGFVIVGDEGKSFRPGGLPKDFQHDGLRVSYRLRESMALGTCPPYYDIVSISRRDAD